MVIAKFGENGILRYCHFVVFIQDKMVNMGPIEFQLGLPKNTNVNDRQNKFEVYISKNGAIMTNLNGHISTIYCPILTEIC